MPYQPLRELTALPDAKNNLALWLRAWFDGADHAVGRNSPVTFPKCDVKFDQGAMEQPLDSGSNPRKETGNNTEIRVVLTSRAEMARDTSTGAGGRKLVASHVLINFWVRSQQPKPEDANQLAGRVAQLLHAILLNPAARRDLSLNGINHLQPREPQTNTANTWAERLVACGAQLQYEASY
jgi:hypothetical protein